MMLGIALVAGASAHIELTTPPARYTDIIKNRPCGRTEDVRSNNPIVLLSGATIEVVWTEYVRHPSHYRIAFDADGQDFVDPASQYSFYDSPSDDPGSVVLLDDIGDLGGTGERSAQVTLPDIECDNCTLQLIQVMYDKNPEVFGDNDLYYQCADLVLESDAVADPTIVVPDDTGSTGDGDRDGADEDVAASMADDSGCAVVPLGSAAGWFVLSGLAATARRR